MNEMRKEKYEGAVRLLPFHSRQYAMEIDEKLASQVEEFRLRTGKPVSALINGREYSIGKDNVTINDLNTLIELSTGASAYSCREQLKNGFVTAAGGYRIGVCGTVARGVDDIVGYTMFSSANIRIPSEISGVSDEPLKYIFQKGFGSVLIVSPPGLGKTTLLRDMAASLSDGRLDGVKRRVAICDERGELAATYKGEAQLYVGKCTDVLDMCPKDKGINMLLRAMNPEIIVVDEITDERDSEAILRANSCGVYLAASAHGSGIEDILRRPAYKKLVDNHVFSYVINIKKESNKRKYIVSEVGGECLD